MPRCRAYAVGISLRTEMGMPLPIPDAVALIVLSALPPPNHLLAFPSATPAAPHFLMRCLAVPPAGPFMVGGTQGAGYPLHLPEAMVFNLFSRPRSMVRGSAKYPSGPVGRGRMAGGAGRQPDRRSHGFPAHNVAPWLPSARWGSEGSAAVPLSAACSCRPRAPSRGVRRGRPFREQPHVAARATSS